MNLRGFFVSFAFFALALPTFAQTYGRDDSYENHNQVDYGPVKISILQGTANDPGGGPVPNALILLFTESGHTLVAKTKTDRNGDFRLARAPAGSYRLVAKAYGWCTANVPLLVEKRKQREKLILHMEIGAIDHCSYGSLE